MIHSLEINDFRGFENKSIKLGKYITAISGKNGLGKSTILALIGNACELKVADGKTIFNSQFGTKFGEIFKASKEFDKSGSNKCKINFSLLTRPNEINDVKICRVTWQKDRFRLIPESKGETINSRKKEWPSIYLGLSRLYPIGEAKDEGVNIKDINLSSEERKHFLENYVEILNLDVNDEIGVELINIDETSRKKGVGVTTSQYSAVTNSAGQDNIGQIILAILSFERLSKSKYSSYNGGLLLIDEIDATLHPVAQIKLIRYLYKMCKHLRLQVIFTTHSVSLLEDICMKTIHNKDEETNNYEIVYLTKRNGPLEILRNPEFFVINNDLKISNAYKSLKQIPVYAEDAEGRWLFDNLIDKYKIYVNNIDITLGCSQLLQLNKADPLYFSNVLFVLDGDVEEEDIKVSSTMKNVIKLPGDVRPEQVIYDFLIGLENDNEFWVFANRIGFNKEALKEHGPLSNDYQGKERERYKKWFKNNLSIIDSLEVVKYWKESNCTEYNEFIKNFKNAYNEIAKRNFYPIIN